MRSGWLWQFQQLHLAYNFVFFIYVCCYFALWNNMLHVTLDYHFPHIIIIVVIVAIIIVIIIIIIISIYYFLIAYYYFTC